MITDVGLCFESRCTEKGRGTQWSAIAPHLYSNLRTYCNFSTRAEFLNISASLSVGLSRPGVQSSHAGCSFFKYSPQSIQATKGIFLVPVLPTRLRSPPPQGLGSHRVGSFVDLTLQLIIKTPTRSSTKGNPPFHVPPTLLGNLATSAVCWVAPAAYDFD